MVLGLAFCLALLIPALAAADEAAKNVFERGRFELEDGNYEEALKFLDQAIQMDPSDLTFQYHRARALIKLEREAEAEEALVKLLSADPTGQPNVYVELASLYGKQQKWSNAADNYSKALNIVPDRGDIYLARGAMFLEMKDYAKADTDFQEAARVSPSLAAPAAYNRAMVPYRQGNLDETLTLLETAQSLKPEEGLARAISDLRVSVAKEKRRRKAWSVDAAVVFQFDDNVSLEPLDGLGVGTPGAPTRDKEDMAYGLSAGAKYYFINRREAEVGVAYKFQSLFYSDLTENDILSHTFGGFFAFNPSPWYFNVAADYGFYYGDGEHRLNLFAISPSVTRLFGKHDRTTAHASLEYKSYKDGSDDVRRVVLGATHFHSFTVLTNRALTVRGGVQYERDDPIGDLAAASSTFEIKGGVNFPLPFLLEADLGVGYAWVDFESNTNIDPDEKREDKRWTLSAKLGRNIGDFMRVDLMWNYTFNDSNTTDGTGKDLYEFNRNVYTLLVSGHF